MISHIIWVINNLVAYAISQPRKLQAEDLIALIRWLAERMASLYTKESRNA